MNPITAPIGPESKSDSIAILQEALLLLITRRALPLEPAELPDAERALREERSASKYGEATGKIITRFQKDRRINASGLVDEATASALNSVLESLGAFGGVPASPIVSGVVRREDGLPQAGLRIAAVHVANQSEIHLGDDQTDSQGRYTIRYQRLPGVESIRLRVSATSGAGSLLTSSAVIRDPKSLEVVDLTAPFDSPLPSNQRIEGTIVLQHGLPAEKLKLRLYRRRFGGEPELLNETTTVTAGRYAFSFDSGTPAAGLEIRAVKANGEEVPLSKPINEVTRESRTSLNLVAPSALQPLGAEYQRLTAALLPRVTRMATLAAAKEDAQQQDITVLNRDTGWDARLIALASVTEKLAADQDVAAAGLPSEGLYGLLRAGLPSDKRLLALIPPEVVSMAIKKAREVGIVEMSNDAMDDFQAKFTKFATNTRLAAPTPGSRSTYGDLLRSSDLTLEAQQAFASTFLAHRGDGAQLWKEAEKAGLDRSQIAKLQLQGKLAFLAGNSGKMVDALARNNRFQNPVELVDQGFHRADAWKDEVFALAGIPQERRASLTEADRRELEAIIPEAYAGEKVESRLDAYADDMARKIRFSYPTQVVGRLMETDPVYRLATAHDATVTLLQRATKQGFRLGDTPAGTFLKSNPSILEGVEDVQAAEQQLKAVQRVYQITPNNEAMPVLMSMGIHSAADVVAYAEEHFASQFKAKYRDIHKHETPPIVPSEIIHRARQVSAVTHNLFTMARSVGGTSGGAATSASPKVIESVKNELIKHFPTMESLFGSLDFCECEHCRSVLSPAAYLVDLLQFVDQANRDVNPYDVLVERRPDLPHLSLTCDNTHTALPYIDIVNEIFEYYVAHGKLEQAAGHDTGNVRTAELLAEPQNVIREAYDVLRKARYPLNLPFDLWIETVRQFGNFFETPLHRLLEVFRPADNLFDAAQTYDRAAIFLESLGLSPAEAAIFTDSNPLAKWHELYGFTTAEEALTEATDKAGQRIDLNSAKALSRRLGVTYKEIAAIVQTGFVNPEFLSSGLDGANPSKLTLLSKIGVSVGDARFYKDHKTFYEKNKDLIGKERGTLTPVDRLRLDSLDNTVPGTPFTGWKIVKELDAFEQRLDSYSKKFKDLKDLHAEVLAIPLDRIVVLADLDTGCNFDRTIVRYADGHKADAIVFLRINLFVRLWRKLGWSIEETDRALTTLMPRSAPLDGSATNFAKRPFQTVLIYLAHLKELDEKLKIGKQGRIKLLTLWSDMGTTGDRSLYEQLFLTRSVLGASPVFDHPLGNYLSDPHVETKDHLLTLQGALGLTADEISRILRNAPASLNTEKLSLAVVSLLYRHQLLAKSLKLKIPELIALQELSGVDPFKPLDPDPLSTLDQDHPFVETLEFVKIAGEVKDSGLSIEELEFLLRQHPDKTGTHQPNPEGTLALVKLLADGVRSIHETHRVPDERGPFSEDDLRQMLSLALPADAATTLMGMLDGAAEFTVTRSAVVLEDSLKPEDFIAEPAIRELRYNEARQEQKLTVRLFDPRRQGLETRHDSKVLKDLLVDAEAMARRFFTDHVQKRKLRREGEVGFLDKAEFNSLSAPLRPLVQILKTDSPDEVERKSKLNEEITNENLSTLRSRRFQMAKAFIPFLQRRLIRQFLAQQLTEQTGGEPALVETLLTEEGLLANTGNLLDAFSAIHERGVLVTFLDGSGSPLAGQPVLSIDADTRARDRNGNRLQPAGAKAARFDGYLEVPVTGAYRFYIELDKVDSTAELRFAHRVEPLFIQGRAAKDSDVLGDLPDEYLQLKAGVPYPFSLKVEQLGDGGARLRVQGETLPRGPLSQLTLYPPAIGDAASSATILLAKALRIVQGLGLSGREVRHLLTHAEDFGGIRLHDLPTKNSGGSAEEAADARERFLGFRRLASYARLKRELAAGTEDLIDIFEANATAGADRLVKEVYPRIAKLTRRDEATVRATAEALVKTPTFASEEPLWRLWEALQVVERFGVPPASLLRWTAIVGNATTDELRFEIARDVRGAIKARFSPESWQRVAQPIFDKLRQRQRDSLVSHILHQRRFDRMEELYEHFLIDPGMEPVVQTSRVRLAISSLQLFIQRCLLNLEQKVPPSAINAKHWEWMKRYRVWEANRKIFLFPENWLEPEFRDDKTHLFSELEGALLQGDVSEDLVEDAFLSYLRKLDELARLDIVAMHIEDGPDSAARNLHVFGRTYSQPHKYFYRRFARGMWTPWEPVSAEIEGDHLAPVVWRDRLYLFWVTFLEKPQQASGEAKEIDPKQTIKVPAPLKDVEAHLHWSEYLNGTWTTQESSAMNTESPIVAKGLASFTPADILVHVSKEYDAEREMGVLIHLDGLRGLVVNGKIVASNNGVMTCAFYLASRNSEPSGKLVESFAENKFTTATQKYANRYRGSGELKVSFRERIITESGKPQTPVVRNTSVLGAGGAYTLLPCNNDLTNFGDSKGASEVASNPAAVKAAIESGLDEIRALVKPVFYQDDRHTLFVEPDLTERTIEDWDEWVPKPPQPESDWLIPDRWKDLELNPVVVIPDRKGPVWNPPTINRNSILNIRDRSDWLTNATSAVKFENVLLGPTGQPGLAIRDGGTVLGGQSHLLVNAGSELTRGSIVVLDNEEAFAGSGLRVGAGGLNVIGSTGFNSAQERNFNDHARGALSKERNT